MTINLISRRALWLFAFVSLAWQMQAQAPAGYYTAAKGTKGAAIKTALYHIVADHVERSYNQLWSDFKQTDLRPDGKIWDMYSGITSYEPGGSAQGANYKKEGDSYNREHSFPKSWFDNGKPMYTDLFHLYPTDGYVNNRRSNYPLGETDGEQYQSAGGFSKLGSCTWPGYSGTVFEPNDEYKGDFARTYFYMATAYENKIASWSSPMLAGNKYPAYASWVVSMLLKWAAEDPVSQKEIDRNNAVYGIQHNRNPYIDFPGLEQYVWGNKQDVAFDPDNYDGSGTTQPDELAAPQFDPAPGVVAKGTTVSITATDGAQIHYTVNEAAEQVSNTSVSLTIDATTSLTAYATQGTLTSPMARATYTVESEVPSGSNVYALVTSADQLTSGAGVLIVCVDKAVALGAVSKDVRSAAQVSVSNDRIETATGGEGLPYVVQVSAAGGDRFTLYSPADASYLSLTSDANKLNASDQATDDGAQWTLSIAGDGTATIANAQYAERTICYNASSPRFACYKSTSKQQPVALFVSTATTGLTDIKRDQQGYVSVTDLSGRVVRRSVDAQHALQGLPAGIYVVGGRKVIVR